MTKSRRARSSSLLALTIALAACAPRAHQDLYGSTSKSWTADSLMLRRTRCFGYCPTYSITVTRSGRVNYRHGDPRDTASASVSSTAPSTLTFLSARARAIGFFDLPVEIARDPELCPNRATDMPTAIITIFVSDSATSVSDYHGCFIGRDLSAPPRLVRLRDFEAEIDSILGSARFVNRPPPA